MCWSGKVDEDSASVSVKWRYVLGIRPKPASYPDSQRPAHGQLLGRDERKVL